MNALSPPRLGVPLGSVLASGEVQPSTEYLRFFNALVAKVGGSSGASSDDLALSQFDDAGIEETKAAVFALADVAAQTAGMGALVSQIEALRIRIEALEQGKI